MLKKKIILIIGIIITVILSTLVLINLNNISKTDAQPVSEQKELDEIIKENNIINIAECSEEFMNKYYREISELNKELEECKEEISEPSETKTIIITSKNKIEDTFGATKIIEAPNNQYILKYETVGQTEVALEKFKNNENILSADYNNIFYMTENETTATTYNSWGIEAMGLDEMSNKIEGNNSNEIVAAIIDSGLDLELFNSNYSNKLKEMWNVLESNETMVDETGHGTHIAGTIAEATPSNVKIIPVKVTTSKSLYTTDIVAGINYIVKKQNADVINMSFGSEHEDPNLYVAIEAANEQNIICVAASGNDGKAFCNYPAAFNNTISVSACNSSKNIADFSTYHNTVTFTAPGESILSINGIGNGTSMAAPHVVSAVSIAKCYDKSYNLEEITNCLKHYCEDIGEYGKDIYFGYGFINFNDAEECACECDNCDKIYCSGCECEECILNKKSEIANIELYEPVSVTTYNYGTLSNLSPIKLKIYSEDTYIVANLLELEDCEIIGYDPYTKEAQELTIKYKDQILKIQLEAGINSEKSAWTYEAIDDKNAKITRIEGKDINVLYFPDKLDGYTITEIGDNCYWAYYLNPKKVILPTSINKIDGFGGKQNLEEVSILSETISIGSSAFYNCTALNVVNLPNLVTSIGSSAFYNCKQLEEINILNGITEIKDNTFYGCSSLKNITIPETLTSIGNDAFSGCLALENIEIPDSVTNIGWKAFYNCTQLEEISIPNGVTEIKASTFQGCTSIKNIKIPNTVTVIKNTAFYNCKKLKEVNISYGLTEIGDTAFYGCSSLENIKFPDSITSIGGLAFYDCKNLEKIDLPKKMNTIKNEAFKNCTSLTEINLPKDVTNIGSNIFEDSILNVSENFLGTNKIAQDVNLPEILKRTKTEGDILYTSDDWTFNNCEVSNDGSKIVRTNEGDAYIVVNGGILNGFKVMLKEQFLSLKEIKIETKPDKTIYISGDKFDTTGMKVIAVYVNEDDVETSFEIIDYIVENGENLQKRTR